MKNLIPCVALLTITGCYDRALLLEGEGSLGGATSSASHVPEPSSSVGGAGGAAAQTGIGSKGGVGSEAPGSGLAPSTGGASIDPARLGIAGAGGVGAWSPGVVTELPTANIRGLCFDETDLYVVDSDAFQVVRFHWPELTPFASYAIPTNAGPSVLGDCAILDGVLYYADVGKGAIGTIDLATGVVNPSQFSAPAGRPRSIAADAGTLWVSCDDAPRLFRMSRTGEILESVRNIATVNACEGLEATATGLWCTDTALGAALQFSKSDGSVVTGPFIVPYWEGLALRGATLWAGTNGLMHTPTALVGPTQGGRVGIAPLDWARTDGNTGIDQNSAIPEDCQGSIDFPDAELEAAVRSAIEKSDGELLHSDVVGLRLLETPLSQISDLTGIQCLTSLYSLDLHGRGIRDISALSGMTQLVWVSIVDSGVRDFAALAGLPNLAVLDLRNNGISDITMLGGLPNLDQIDLAQNDIGDLGALIENSGIGSGDHIDLSRNSLDCGNPTTVGHLAELEARGVHIVNQGCN